MKLIYLALLLPVFSHVHAATPSDKNCDYYLDLEKEKSCWIREKKSSNYLVEYGYKYCSLYHLNATHWKDERADFVNKNALCLQSFLANLSPDTNCQDLETSAFNSHPDCYEQDGFCQLNRGQQVSIIWTAAQLDVLLKPGKSFLQFFRILKKCKAETRRETDAFFARVKQLYQEGKIPNEKLTALFDIDRLPAEAVDPYAANGLALLLATDRQSRTYHGFTSLFGDHKASHLEIRLRCFAEGHWKDYKTCQSALSLAGSRKNLEEMLSLPPETSIDQVINLKKSLETDAR